MQVLVLLAFIATGYAAGPKIYRDTSEQKPISHYRRSGGTPLSSERPFRARSRVFRNVQVQLDDEPRLYRASGRFHKKVAAAAPIHTVTTTSKSTSSELSTPNPLGYDEGSHHVNKMTEDNSVMEEAAEFAKGLERTTVAVRNDDWPRTTTAPLTNSLNVPAIITPRVLMDEKRPPLMKPPQLAYPQQLPMGRPQPEIFTNTVSVQNNPTDGTLPFNPLVPPSAALQNIYQPIPPLGVVTPPVPPPPAFPDRSEVINGQAANSSLEQLGCGFDWLTNSCKDVFNIGWCGQCHDFGNIFVHDCKCVHPLIALPPRQAPPPPRPAFFSMI